MAGSAAAARREWARASARRRARRLGWMGVLFTRGPEAVLAKGTTLEMVLDRQVNFNEDDLDFSNSPVRRNGSGDGRGPLPSQKSTQRRFPRGGL